MNHKPRSVIFGDDAGSYDANRPSYPFEAVSHVNGLFDWVEALEVGAGTGKATGSFAGDGRSIVAIEPSPEMAEVLREKNLPGVMVVESSFEDFGSSPESFDLVFAAQSWHWVDRSTAYRRAHGFLRPGGGLALIWNVPSDRYSQFASVYSKHAPHLLAEQDERIKRRDSHVWHREMSEAGFVATDVFTHEWSVEMSPSRYRSLHGTYSDHMMLPAETREALLDDLERAVADRGSVTLDYTTNVFTGRVSHA